MLRILCVCFFCCSIMLLLLWTQYNVVSPQLDNKIEIKTSISPLSTTKIVVVPILGLGNRINTLRMLAVTLQCSDLISLDFELLIHWPKNEDCNADYYKLFKSPIMPILNTTLMQERIQSDKYIVLTHTGKYATYEKL